MTDGLTGLANRRQCDEALTSEIARVSRFGGSFAVVLADLDGFKDLNDTHGHATGDAVLREVGALLQRTLRASDLAGRWGGEEFLLLLRETSLRGALELAERVRSALEACTILAVDGTPLHVTASFGVGVFDADEDADVVAAADAALYVAKRGGKNRVAPLIREVQPLAPGG
jgi:diguanylate cyclase (GGDEF)-like protein